MTVAATTIVGNIVRNPERRVSRSDASMARFRLAADRRYLDRDGQWKSTDQLYITVNCYGTLADNVLACLQSGMGVIVSGRIVTYEWKDDQGNKHSGIFLRANAIGPSLSSHSVKVMARAKPMKDDVDEAVAAQTTNAAVDAAQAPQVPADASELVGAGVSAGQEDSERSGSFYDEHATAPM